MITCMYHYYYAEPFDLMYAGTDSGNQRSLASYTNGVSGFSTRPGWSFDVFSTRGGGIGFEVGYTWRF